MIRNTDFLGFLHALEDMQLFSLCSDFDKLSLDEQVPAESEGTTTKLYYPASNLERMRGRLTDHWQRTFIESLRAPFAPADFLIPAAHGIKLGVGFRFTPGQQKFLFRELMLPVYLDKLLVFSGELGLTYYTAPLNPSAIPVHGIGDLVESDRNKVLIEVLTDGVGKYGRILVLVILGVGCTTWFSFIPHGTDIGSTFQPFDDYAPFFNDQYVTPGFDKCRFVETQNVSRNVGTLMQNPPFTELEIPANGYMLKAVGLGVMIAIFVALGITPESLPVA
jgi:hypothetical protein